MLRGFATARPALMDPEQGISDSHVPNRRNHGQRRLDSGASQVSSNTSAASSFGRAILLFCLALLVLGVLPATFVLWTCIIVVVLIFMRLRLQAQHLHQALEQDDFGRRGTGRLQGGGSGLPLVRVIPGGGLLLLHTTPQTAMERINIHLRQLDEEMGYAGFDSPLAAHSPFSAAATGAGPARPPLSEADIAALPCFTYKPPRGATAACEGSTSAQAGGPAAAGGKCEGDEGSSARGSKATAVFAASTSQQAPAPGNGGTPAAAMAGGMPGRGCGRTPSSSSSSSSSSLPSSPAGAARAGSTGSTDGCAAAGPPGLTCPVCLDAVAEGSTVMTLPCLHQFHAACVTPWLRQQGLYATCPMCKTPVFQ